MKLIMMAVAASLLSGCISFSSFELEQHREKDGNYGFLVREHFDIK